jgi:hypothetical protein
MFTLLSTSLRSNAMNDQVKETKEAPEIIRGRMPVAVVYMVRYGNMKNESTKAKADKFGTTVGKIDDIVKGRNFAYVTEAFRPTQEQKDQALEWFKRHPNYDQQNVDTLVNELEAIPLATPEEAAAFEAARSAARGQSPKTKGGETADAGGGNRRRKSKKDSEEVEGAPADALLA